MASATASRALGGTPGLGRLHAAAALHVVDVRRGDGVEGRVPGVVSDRTVRVREKKRQERQTYLR